VRLRVRLALFFAVFTSLTIALAFAFTVAVFRDAQQASLDEALTARALVEADEVMLHDGRTLHVQQAPHSKPTALGQLLKYGALFDQAGTVLAQTTTFGELSPTFELLGYRTEMALPSGPFDFSVGPSDPTRHVGCGGPRSTEARQRVAPRCAARRSRR